MCRNRRHTGIFHLRTSSTNVPDSFKRPSTTTSSIRVEYHGVIPDLFKADADVVVESRRGQGGLGVFPPCRSVPLRSELSRSAGPPAWFCRERESAYKPRGSSRIVRSARRKYTQPSLTPAIARKPTAEIRTSPAMKNLLRECVIEVTPHQDLI